MSILIGVVLVVVGVGQIVLRGRIARANAASNRVMFGGRMAGPGWQRYQRSLSILVGAIFVVFGVYTMVSGAF